jgi:putative tricarboxylic transport membrane protein
MDRRRFSHCLLALGLGAALAAGTLLPRTAEAAEALTIVAPAKPGGGWDQTARAMESVLQSTGLASPVTVENIAGAGGTVGLAQLADKYSGRGDVLMVSGLVMVGSILTNKTPVSLDQTAPIARLTGEYEILVVPANSEIKSLGDLLTKLKADPGSVSWGGGSAGGTDHILAAMIAKAVGIDGSKVNYVPFSGGGEALAAILGGHVTVGVSGLGEWLGQIQSGELRAIAISAPERVAGVDIPTIKEQGIDVSLANWRAVFGPPELEDAKKQALIDMVDKMAKSDAWKKSLGEKGWMDLYLSGDAFAAFLKEENTRVADTLKSIGLVQ